MKGEKGFTVLEGMSALVVLLLFLGGSGLLLTHVAREQRLAEQVQRATTMANDLLEEARIGGPSTQEMQVQAGGIRYQAELTSQPHEGKTALTARVNWLDGGERHEVVFTTLAEAQEEAKGGTAP